MDRPTKEQIEAARRELEMMLDAARSGHAIAIDAIRIEALEHILAATAEPTEKELAEEACAAVIADCGLEGQEADEVRAHILDSLPYASDHVDHAAEARAYIRGARREGAR
jgi:hypothetical protein